jgi:hypothetical protein
MLCHLCRRSYIQLALVSAIVGAAAISASAASTGPNVQTIIEKSVEANQADFKAAPGFSHRECDRTANGSKTWEVMMIDGSPYQRLIAVNDEPLSKDEDKKEQRKLNEAIAKRKSESAEQRQQRIAKYQKERLRDHAMMQQLTVAFEFKLIDRRTVNSRQVYVLQATPKPGYRPPNMAARVLPGMQGELWIDVETYQWVKVTAEVIHPVSIEGFLAQVEPGTQFELENMPVADGVWLPKHFSMGSHAKVLHLFNRSSEEDETYSDYKRISGDSKGQRAIH